jgi:hypothetical protein
MPRVVCASSAPRAVFIEGAHSYRLVGMNTVLLRPIQHKAGSPGA